MTGRWALALMLSYLAGSIPTAYILVKRLKRIDVRTVGSGNAGATNVSRAAGFKAGLAVFICDALKGVIAVKLIAAAGFPGNTMAALLCGVAAVIGHIAPVWLGFRGGKGVATTIGVLISAMPAVSLVCLLVWWIVFLLSRIVSLASILALGAVPMAQWAWHFPQRETAVGGALALMVIAKHHANIVRILQGSEQQWKSTKHK